MARVYVTEECPELIGGFSNCTSYRKQFRKEDKPTDIQETVECLTLPRSKNCHKEEVYEEYYEPISHLIIPYLKLFHWTLLVPDSLEFDLTTHRYICKKGSRTVNMLSYIWLLLMSIYMTMILVNDMGGPFTMASIISKLMWLSYTIFDIAVIKGIRKNGPKIAKLLTEGRKILCWSHRIKSAKDTPQKRRNYLKYISWILAATGLIYTFGFLIVVIVELTATTTNLYSMFLNFTAIPGSLNRSECEYKDILCNFLERSSHNYLATLSLAMWMTMAFSVELIWVTFLLMIVTWGFYFRRLFSGCTDSIEAYHVDLYEGIKVYSKVTLLLEKFNKMFGATILWIVIAVTLYMAATLGTFLAGESRGLLYDTVNIAGFLPFVAAMLTASEVQRKGHKLPNIIKKQFLDFSPQNNNRQTVQIVHAASAVQYDSVSNNIGIKGLGYFTVSYAFIARLIGVTLTYSMVTLQLTRGEIPIF